MLDFSDPKFSFALSIRGPIISCFRCAGLISEKPRISSSSSFDCVNEKSSKFYVWSSKLLFYCVTFRSKLNTSRLFILTIHLVSRLTHCLNSIHGLKEKVSLVLVSLFSNVSSGFVWVCLRSVSQLLVHEHKKSSVPIFGPIMFKLIWAL